MSRESIRKNPPKNEKGDHYSDILRISRQSSLLEGVSHLLEWEQETYMPPGANSIRAEQLSLLAGLIHKGKTEKKFSSALAKCIDMKTGKILEEKLSVEKKVALKEWRKNFLKETALPTSFVEEFAKLTSQAMEVWRISRKEDTFSRFAPYLERIVAMNRRKAELLGYKAHPYDALLDLYEPNIKTKEINVLFSNLQKAIKSILKAIQKGPQPDDSFLFGTFDQDKQIAFGKVILEKMGYDSQHGRLDISTHPFSSSTHPTDTRITTRIHPTGIMNCITSILHEAGHGLYEKGLPQEHFGSPLGEPISHGIHESQSRWWETRIGQSEAFWHYFLPILKKTFKGKFDHVSLRQFYLALNKVQPSLIRVEADQVTYNLHIILRFEIERDLIAGMINIRDIPEIWNAKMKEYLGIVPKTNREGCLQDVHWSMGAFGYFPSYTLGNLYAAHLFNAFSKQHPDWEKRVSNGELLFIKDWLYHNVHRYGKRYTSLELLKKVTGKPFDETALITHLKGLCPLTPPRGR